jgi:hypothetical protein
MSARPIQDRQAQAERRLRSVLRTNVVANARTLEQKISDAGPSNMRVDPHVLTPVRQRLEREGVISFTQRASMHWYHLADTAQPLIDERLATLVPIHTSLRQENFTKRVGQALEIAAYRSFVAQPLLQTLGGYLDLDAHDDDHLYSKEEPPSTISGRSHRGRLDFVLVTRTGNFAGVEIKNVREWLYPDRPEVRELINKATVLDVVPVLIARRIPYVTFKLLTTCGAIVHQTYNQLFPATDAALADKARHKDLLGYHDIRVGNQPDARLTRFVTQHLPQLVDSQRPVFDNFKDLLRAFSHRSISYVEFAARVRRRVDGTNEDADWDT